MIVAEHRPRNLKWFHSGPLLFGDWGTSRLYVLGLAFFYTGHASAIYLTVMAVLMALVAWGYTIVCRCFPDGGGVYTSARMINPTLSVIGATLLLCDYIVTAALSTVEAFHYFGVGERWVVPLSVLAIGGLGVINWIGSRNSGRFALVIALCAIGVSVMIAMMCVPFFREGLRSFHATQEGVSTPWQHWESLVRIMLALSGVEAVANMTGLMAHPVARTARRTIWPVLIEVVVLNFVFGMALQGLPQLRDVQRPDYTTYVTHAAPGTPIPEEVLEYRDTGIKMLAHESGRLTLGEAAGTAFGVAAAVAFGLLLLSASNTAVVDMIAVQYAMARDGEIPRRFSSLNYSGVPWLGLLVAVAVPSLVLIVEDDVALLGELYAVGVVGAITINMLCCSVNRGIDIRRWERGLLGFIGVVLGATELTIIVTKPHAAVFAGSIVATVLMTRLALQQARRDADARASADPRWLGELSRPWPELEAGRPRVMFAARSEGVSDYALRLARERGAALFAVFVRRLRVADLAGAGSGGIGGDIEAQRILGGIALRAREAGVPFFPIYVESGGDVAQEVVNNAVAFGCDTVVAGRSARAWPVRALGGDITRRIEELLPPNIALSVRGAAS